LFQLDDVVARQLEAKALSRWLSSFIEDKTALVNEINIEELNEKMNELLNKKTIQQLNKVTSKRVNEKWENRSIIEDFTCICDSDYRDNVGPRSLVKCFLNYLLS